MKLNTAPYLNFSKVSNYSFLAGNKSGKIQLPKILDKEYNSLFNLAVTYKNSTTLPYFIKFDSRLRSFAINSVSQSDQGNYTLIVNVSEILAPSYFSTYTINIMMTPPKKASSS